MARKYDRYGRNRQFRRNPTRSRKFFPQILPFLPDFRLTLERDKPVSQYQAAKWRDIVRGARFRTERRAEAARDKRDRDVMSEMIGAFRPNKRVARGALDIGEAMLIAEAPPVAIPIIGLEMVMNPKKFSRIAGGSAIAGSAGLAYLGARNLI
tara:strand:- start:64 stop:522 length:459 start_codon:yes stop_codon:yes gene_type:complete